MNRSILKGLIATAVLAAAGGAFAQARQLKWAHVYETSEPYHTESVWAAEEIKKRSNGKFDIKVFPASSLGKETDLNQGPRTDLWRGRLQRSRTVWSPFPVLGRHWCRRREDEVQAGGTGIRGDDAEESRPRRSDEGD